MYARLVLHHRGRSIFLRTEPSVVRRLETTFTPLGAVTDEATVLSRSFLFKDPRWRAQVAFARETVDYRVVCYVSQRDQVQLHLEPIEMNLRDACANVWRSAHRASRLNLVRLNGLTVTNEETGTDVTTAVAGSET